MNIVTLYHAFHKKAMVFYKNVCYNVIEVRLESHIKCVSPSQSMNIVTLYHAFHKKAMVFYKNVCYNVIEVRLESHIKCVN